MYNSPLQVLLIRLYKQDPKPYRISAVINVRLRLYDSQDLLKMDIHKKTQVLHFQ